MIAIFKAATVVSLAFMVSLKAQPITFLSAKSSVSSPETLSRLRQKVFRS